MTVIGAFLINGVGNFYISEFYVQMERTFSPDFISQLQRIAAQSPDAPDEMKELLMAQSGLGIDISGRNVYILFADRRCADRLEPDGARRYHVQYPDGHERRSGAGKLHCQRLYGSGRAHPDGRGELYRLRPRQQGDGGQADRRGAQHHFAGAGAGPCDLHRAFVPAGADPHHAHPRADHRHPSGRRGRLRRSWRSRAATRSAC